MAQEEDEVGQAQDFWSSAEIAMAPAKATKCSVSAAVANRNAASHAVSGYFWLTYRTLVADSASDVTVTF